ncbi:MAG: hypothetical protein ACI8ZM_002377 [Crocinitomix sp.]|jgi:hypothetical protein
MKLKKTMFTALAITVFNGLTFGQDFEKIISKAGYDFNHYSIETTIEGDYVCAGTLFDPGGMTDIHIFKLQTNGTMIWEKIIDESDDDRALDLVIGDNGDIVVTGYVSTTALHASELYIVKLTSAGGFIADHKLDYDGRATAGTNVIKSFHNDHYIVGGWKAAANTYPLISNKALIIEFDHLLQPNGTVRTFKAGLNKHNSINDIVAIPTGYFITGSAGFKSGGIEFQGVLAIFVDHNFNVNTDLSFESTNHEHIGVSAVFTADNDALYLMSNNSVLHNPQITVFSNVSSGPAVSHEYYLALDTTYGNYNAAGFHLVESPWSPDALVAMGYYRTKVDLAANTNSAIPWIAEFESSNGNQLLGKVWPAPSPNFYTHGGGVFSTFQGEAPYIFNQEMFTERADGIGFVLISPITVLTNYGIDLVTITASTTACFEANDFEVDTLTSRSITTDDHGFGINASAPGYSLTAFTSDSTLFCPAIDHPNNPEDGNNNPDNGAPQSNKPGFGIHDLTINTLEVYPNPLVNQLTVSISGENLNGQLILTNTMGQVIYQQTIQSQGEFRTEINLENNPKGIYFLRFEDNHNQLVQKLIKL